VVGIATSGTASAIFIFFSPKLAPRVDRFWTGQAARRQAKDSEFQSLVATFAQHPERLPIHVGAELARMLLSATLFLVAIALMISLPSSTLSEYVYWVLGAIASLGMILGLVRLWNLFGNLVTLHAALTTTWGLETSREPTPVEPQDPSDLPRSTDQEATDEA
jgi:hypothetical protein